jgi:DNA-binding MarR family transcriptional regulator
MTRRKTSPKAAHDYAGLDRVMHEKARLSLLIALLSRNDGALFPELKQLCALTDGNLNRHLAVLQQAELIEVWKSHAGPRSKTRVQLTRSGRRQFLAYLDELERVIRDARADAPAGERRRRQPTDDAGLVPA